MTILTHLISPLVVSSFSKIEIATKRASFPTCDSKKSVRMVLLAVAEICPYFVKREGAQH
jgi:hypothetical protein